MEVVVVSYQEQAVAIVEVITEATTRVGKANQCNSNSNKILLWLAGRTTKARAQRK